MKSRLLRAPRSDTWPVRSFLHLSKMLQGGWWWDMQPGGDPISDLGARALSTVTYQHAQRATSIPSDIESAIKSEQY